MIIFSPRIGRHAKAITMSLPNCKEILAFIEGHTAKIRKREIARAFNLDSDQRKMLKKLLRAMLDEGKLERHRNGVFTAPGTLPKIIVVEIFEIDIDGNIIARPVGSLFKKDKIAPKIFITTKNNNISAPGINSQALVQLKKITSRTYEGKIIRLLPTKLKSLLGVLELASNRKWYLRPINKKTRSNIEISLQDDDDPKPDQLVHAEIISVDKFKQQRARIIETFPADSSLKSISLLSIYDHKIPFEFSVEAIQEAKKSKPTFLENRLDLRSIPFVTIDSIDARDFDDAIFAEPDTSPNNVDGFHIIVAIADVSWYVPANSAIDRNAHKRGNSVYFPDRVVPMLPEALSNNLCSLLPNEDRPCLAVHIWIDKSGKIIKHHFERVLIRSVARLTYEQVQSAYNGDGDHMTEELRTNVIEPIYKTYDLLVLNRKIRGSLELDVLERSITLKSDGRVKSIDTPLRLDSHKLIEEFMIAANVAAAETLEREALPCMYRVHEAPSNDKLFALGELLKLLNIKLIKNQALNAKMFNSILNKAKNTPHQELISMAILRAQAKAEYSPNNIGHFGLALERYCHFTSPIRRYSDLIVHRALINYIHSSQSELFDEVNNLVTSAQHLSLTERRAISAERDAIERYSAHYLNDKIGDVFQSYISGVGNFGLFATLRVTGADGFIPISSIPGGYYHYDEIKHSLFCHSSGTSYRLGDPIKVRLKESNPLTGGLILELVDDFNQRRVGTSNAKKNFRKTKLRNKFKKKHRKTLAD